MFQIDVMLRIILEFEAAWLTIVCIESLALPSMNYI
jgi:hypothetical protein